MEILQSRLSKPALDHWTSRSKWSLSREKSASPQDILRANQTDAEQEVKCLRHLIRLCCKSAEIMVSRDKSVLGCAKGLWPSHFHYFFPYPLLLWTLSEEKRREKRDHRIVQAPSAISPVQTIKEYLLTQCFTLTKKFRPESECE